MLLYTYLSSLSFNLISHLICSGKVNTVTSSSEFTKKEQQDIVQFPWSTDISKTVAKHSEGILFYLQIEEK